MGKQILETLTISHFRTHKFSKLEFLQKPTVIFGKNGVGKTNILEAISLLAPGRGLRQAKSEDMSRQPDLLGWKITADVDINGTKFEVCTWWDGHGSRKISIDGKLVTQVELGKLFRILWITPQMDRLWMEGSGERRRFLDRIVATIVTGHTENLLKYNKALRQRNKLLRDKSKDERWFSALENQMSESGELIEAARSEAILKIVDAQDQSKNSFPIACLSLDRKNLVQADEFKLSLRNNRKIDLVAGRTLIGPHLTDLRAEYESKATNAKNCSTGEQKALLISIILATAKIQLQQFGTPPILLFDEVSAHFDGERQSVLYKEISSLGAQVFLTGTNRLFFSELEDYAKFFCLCSKLGETFLDVG